MRTVYKYEKDIGDKLEFDLPKGAELLHVNSQSDYGGTCLWALVDPLQDTREKKELRVYRTGHEIKETNLRYINTFTVYKGALWFHAFEVLK